jgi:hypothetical protein
MDVPPLGCIDKPRRVDRARVFPRLDGGIRTVPAVVPALVAPVPVAAAERRLGARRIDAVTRPWRADLHVNPRRGPSKVFEPDSCRHEQGQVVEAPLPERPVVVAKSTASPRRWLDLCAAPGVTALMDAGRQPEFTCNRRPRAWRTAFMRVTVSVRLPRIPAVSSAAWVLSRPISSSFKVIMVRARPVQGPANGPMGAFDLHATTCGPWPYASIRQNAPRECSNKRLLTAPRGRICWADSRSAPPPTAGDRGHERLPGLERGSRATA